MGTVSASFAVKAVGDRFSVSATLDLGDLAKNAAGAVGDLLEVVWDKVTKNKGGGKPAPEPVTDLVYPDDYLGPICEGVQVCETTTYIT